MQFQHISQNKTEYSVNIIPLPWNRPPSPPDGSSILYASSMCAASMTHALGMALIRQEGRKPVLPDFRPLLPLRVFIKTVLTLYQVQYAPDYTIPNCAIIERQMATISGMMTEHTPIGRYPTLWGSLAWVSSLMMFHYLEGNPGRRNRWLQSCALPVGSWQARLLKAAQ